MLSRVFLMPEYWYDAGADQPQFELSALHVTASSDLRVSVFCLEARHIAVFGTVGFWDHSPLAVAWRRFCVVEMHLSAPQIAAKCSSHRYL